MIKGIVSDFINDTHGTSLRYRVSLIFSPSNWISLAKFRRQRANRGWSDKDVWAGGEHIIEITAGILRSLQKGHIDWDTYFINNYVDNYGYESLDEVANDLELFLFWSEDQYTDPLYSNFDTETRYLIEYQLYSQAQNAMHFVAENIGQLWD